MFNCCLGNIYGQQLGTNMYEWMQLGGDINGEANYDESGFAVSISGDGSRTAIGAPYNAGGGTDRGHVRVYSYTTSWGQLGADINGEGNNDRFGFSVSLDSDGSHLAVGAPYNDDGGTNSGHVRVYEYTGSAWSQLGSDIVGPSGDYAGWSVSLSGDGGRVAMGIPKKGSKSTGRTKVYNYNSGTTSWDLMGSEIDGPSDYDYSGNSVSLSSDGTRLAVGAPRWGGGAKE